MYIVIIGCGKLGSTLARELAEQGHDTAVIDSDNENLKRLGSGFNGQRKRGIEYDNDVLLECGIDKSDVFLAVTNDDNINIMASKIAKSIFDVPRVIARVCEPTREFIYHELGIETLNSIQIGAEVIKNRIMEQGSKILSLIDNDLEVIEIHVNRNKKFNVHDIENKFRCIISAVLKGENFILANKEESIEPGDRIICTVSRKEREKLVMALTKEV